MQGYPFVCAIDVRWRDLDLFGHVNNAVFVSYLEHARVQAWRAWKERGQTSVTHFLVARIEIDFKSPIELDERVEVGMGVERVGRSSFTYRYRIEAEGRLAAEATSVQVCFDPKSQAPIPVPDDLREALGTLALSL